MNLDQVRALFPSGYLVDVEILKIPAICQSGSFW